MPVVLLYDWIEELIENLVGTWRAGIDTDAAVFTGTSSHDACFESDALIAFLVLVLVPELARKELVAPIVVVGILHEFPLGLVLGELECEVWQVGLEHLLGILFLLDHSLVGAYTVQSVSHWFRAF